MVRDQRALEGLDDPENQPHEGISFAFQAKEPGLRFAPRTVRMDFAYESSFEAVPADAYERLLHDVASGDHTLFPAEVGVERAWEIVAPVLDAPPPVEPTRRVRGVLPLRPS